MATGWNGSGTFTRGDGTREGDDTWAQAKAASQTINTTAHDTHDEILADGIEACLAKNGENAMTGNLDMGSQSIDNWTQASNVTFGVGVGLTIGGDLKATNGDFTGDLAVANTVTADFLTAADTVTTEILDVNVSSTFNGGSHVFAQNGTATCVNITGSLSASGNLLHVQDENGSDVLLAEGTNYVYINSLRLEAATPASASATGTAGTIAWDSNYIYVCTATNTWKRTSLATW